jgi:hypothetical protein
VYEWSFGACERLVWIPLRFTLCSKRGRGRVHVKRAHSCWAVRLIRLVRSVVDSQMGKPTNGFTSDVIYIETLLRED